MKELTAESVGKRVLVRARLHTTRGTGTHLNIYDDEIYSFERVLYFYSFNDPTFSHFFFKGSSAL